MTQCGFWEEFKTRCLNIMCSCCTWCMYNEVCVYCARAYGGTISYNCIHTMHW